MMVLLTQLDTFYVQNILPIHIHMNTFQFISKCALIYYASCSFKRVLRIIPTNVCCVAIYLLRHVILHRVSFICECICMNVYVIYLLRQRRLNVLITIIIKKITIQPRTPTQTLQQARQVSAVLFIDKRSLVSVPGIAP